MIINNFKPIIIINMISIKQCINSQRNIFKFVIPSFRLNIKKFGITYNDPFYGIFLKTNLNYSII